MVILFDRSFFNVLIIVKIFYIKKYYKYLLLLFKICTAIQLPDLHLFLKFILLKTPTLIILWIFKCPSHYFWHDGSWHFQALLGIRTRISPLHFLTLAWFICIYCPCFTYSNFAYCEIKYKDCWYEGNRKLRDIIMVFE